MKTLIQNGLLVNPRGVNGAYDLSIDGERIEKISAQPLDPAGYDQVIDAQGKWVTPGLVDMHVHLREPGFEYKEDIASGTLAAVHGGFTAVACMPNTNPVNDDVSVTGYIKMKAQQKGHCRVYPIAAITKGLEGKELSEFGLLLQAGAVGFSDDGKPVTDANRMRLALQYALNFDALLLSHCEVASLSAEGSMNEGMVAASLGLKGIPAAAEDAMVARDIMLAETYGSRLHICHVSTKGSVELVRQAKARGVRVSCETAPHYFSATEEWVEGYDTNAKMNPPLRTAGDVQAIKEGLADGTIDAIATDHAPHHLDEKRIEFALALNGIVGLETAFSLGMTNLVEPGLISPERLIELMSARPAEILQVEGGVLKEGAPADIAILDPADSITYTEEMLHSKSKNSPFLGREYRGRVVHTIVGGKVMF